MQSEADVSLQISPDSNRELVLGYRTQGDDEIHALATAGAGRIELYSDGGHDGE